MHINVYEPTNDTPHLPQVIDRVNELLAERGCIGDLDATDLCLPLCITEATNDFGGRAYEDDHDQWHLGFGRTGIHQAEQAVMANTDNEE